MANMGDDLVELVIGVTIAMLAMAFVVFAVALPLYYQEVDKLANDSAVPDTLVTVAENIPIIALVVALLATVLLLNKIRK